ncbi:MAG: helix-turn-helix domain-containing protein [Thermomicrobiales bacterium]
MAVDNGWMFIDRLTKGVYDHVHESWMYDSVARIGRLAGEANGWGRPMIQQITLDFGVKLKRFREARGVSQSKLAERADFDHSYVSRLESGARMPTREAVDRLGQAMKLSQVELDALLASAGFLPRDVTSLLSSEPVIGEVLVLLQDEAVPVEYRENMRQVLRLLAAQARMSSQQPIAVSLGGVAA